jgi:uncharacterized protein (TIGR03000 family)
VTQSNQPAAEVQTVSTTEAAPAHLTINLPADAKVFVDDVPCPADIRAFSTSNLRPGQKYYYDVRAEVTRSGTTMMQTQRVVMEAGQQVSVSFPQLAPVATAQR